MNTTKVMISSFITNLFLIFFKITFGMIGSSSALIADGIHSFSDLITDIFAIVGLKMANKPADLKHPYGHGKLEYVISLTISVIIIILGMTIIYNSFKKEITIPSIFISIISLISLIIKYILSGYIIRKGKQYQNNILISSGKESRTDVISSFFVFISVILMNLSNRISIFKYADLVATILVGILIVKIGYDILKENISLLIEEQEIDENIIKNIKEIIFSDSKVYSIDNLILLKFGSYYKLIAEVGMDHTLLLIEAHNRIEEIENKIKKKIVKIKYITIHINPYIDVKNYKLILISNSECDNVILLDNKEIGKISFSKKDGICYLNEIYINEKYRNKGIGTKIMKDLLKSHSEMIVEISKREIKAINFFRNLGFSIIKYKKGKYLMKKIDL